MSVITIIAAPVQNAESDEHLPLSREVHALATRDGGKVLSFNCLNQLIIQASE